MTHQPVDRASAADLHFLQRGQWFGGLPPALQQAIVRRSVVRSYGKGSRIVTGGAPTGGLFALLAGRVHVRRSADALLHVGEAGFWFGEYSLLSGQPAIGDIVAATSARARFLAVSEFERIVADDPRHFRAFAALLIDRYAIVLRHASDIKRLSAEDRVCGQLDNLAALRRLDARFDGPVDLTLSQSELASMVGVSRQTVCGLLSSLQDRGLVEVAFRKIRVLGAGVAPRVASPRDDGRDGLGPPLRFPVAGRRVGSLVGAPE